LAYTELAARCINVSVFAKLPLKCESKHNEMIHGFTKNTTRTGVRAGVPWRFGLVKRKSLTRPLPRGVGTAVASGS
jgi:hypothetical protein